MKEVRHTWIRWGSSKVDKKCTRCGVMRYATYPEGKQKIIFSKDGKESEVNIPCIQTPNPE